MIIIKYLLLFILCLSGTEQSIGQVPERVREMDRVPLKVKLKFTAHIRTHQGSVVSREIDTVSGYIKIFDRCGRLFSIGKTIRNFSERNGAWRYYDTTGRIRSITLFSADTAICRKEIEYKDGKISLFRYDWELQEPGSYKKITHRVLRKFDLKGKKYTEAYMVDGKRIYVKAYDEKGRAHDVEEIKLEIFGESQ